MSIVVQAPLPAGRCWNSAVSTPEPPSAESEETATEPPPRTEASAGAVSEPVGSVASKRNVSVEGVSALPTSSVAKTLTV